MNKIRQALKPDKNKAFDINDIKIIAGSAVAFFGTWAALVLATAIL